MQIIRKIIEHFYKVKNQPLGRWKLENCDKKVDKKIDFSNKDHCGPCGQYNAKNEIIINELVKNDKYSKIHLFGNVEKTK